MLPSVTVLVALFLPIILGMALWPRLRRGAMGKDPHGYVFRVLAGAFAASAAAVWLSLPIVFHAKDLAGTERDLTDAPTLARMIIDQHESLLKTTEVVNWWAFGMFIVCMHAVFAFPSMVSRMKASSTNTATTT